MKNKKFIDQFKFVEFAVLCFAMAVLFVGCGKDDISKVKIDYGTSSVYSKEDMDAAIDVIREQFSSFEGCELHSLSYMSDEECDNADNIEWMNDLRPDDNGEVFTQCIAFDSSFRSPKKVVVHGRQTKNTLGHGGLHVVKAENGS